MSHFDVTHYCTTFDYIFFLSLLKIAIPNVFFSKGHFCLILIHLLPLYFNFIFTLPFLKVYCLMSLSKHHQATKFKKEATFFSLSFINLDLVPLINYYPFLNQANPLHFFHVYFILKTHGYSSLSYLYISFSLSVSFSRSLYLSLSPSSLSWYSSKTATTCTFFFLYSSLLVI